MVETRSERITVKITQTLFKKLEKLANGISQTPSTLAAVYLGEASIRKAYSALIISLCLTMTAKHLKKCSSL